jgi:hypothetical protein
MRNAMRWKLLRGAVVFVLAAGAAGAQTPGAAGRVAPVPPGVFSAKKVFVSNAGADGGLFPHPFSGGPERGYNNFYAAVQALGKYELVAEPREAELVFELELVGPAGPANPNKVKGASDPLPMFRLRIIDRETHYVLWVLTEEIAQANLQKTHDRNFDDALAALVGDLKKLTDKTAAGPA